MTSSQPAPTEQGKTTSDLPEVSVIDTNGPGTDSHHSSFGERLHAAREAHGWTIESCAQTLKLPVRVLRQLEHDDYDAIDSRVYLGSYITKYGRHLSINDSSVQVELDRLRRVEPLLVATGGISHSRFLLDRYATAATYVVLTAVIVVPMIWLGVREPLDRDLTHLSPLDASPVAQQDAPAMTSSTGALPAAGRPAAPQQVATAPVEQQPLLASMAGFPDIDSRSLPPVPPPITAVTNGQGGHTLGLSLAGASWVEVVDGGGNRLEYGLLAAGSSKTYHSDQPLDVRIGNANGAQISIDGQPLGLDDFRHANVAHFRMQTRDGKASATSL